MRNKDIRKAIGEANLKYWQVAEEYGISDGNFSRLLRKEMSKEKKKEVFESIEKAKRKYVVDNNSLKEA
ncbi:hypothetical protein SH601_05560 [Gracilibacillus sp. S3-1-1]|uniref:Uncharacterized protein n=1 Tax=Gracilibacillus pellucidus TaxID=3095368 RepID=A0ACC6M3P9_9BACI|nr:hypothetical protein [Gracilibacillus sp. S3-1-1]MDX8045452.1 hypothetical protein [Gracilibacillus sp. S3-1-1]